jgi:hypothetical protein
MCLLLKRKMNEFCFHLAGRSGVGERNLKRRFISLPITFRSPLYRLDFI